MSIRIVETVIADTTAGLRAGRDAAQSRADVVELRVDGVGDLDLPAVLADRTAPVIVTCRPVWEGGRYDGIEPDRLRLLRRARALGAEFIDVEFRADWRSVAATEGITGGGMREGLVLSFHDFNGIPAELETIAGAMAASGADVVKIAVTPARLSDCARLASAGRLLRTGTMIGLGPAGTVTRVAPHLFQSCWTYAGPLSALGQIPAEQLRQVFRVGQITPRAALFGVAGRPIGHSLSPRLHNAAFAEAGLDAVYVPLEAVDFADFLAFADAFALRGASVTAPFKLDALAAAASIDPSADAVGAANTLKRTDAGWAAANTDVAGFLDGLAAFEGGAAPFAAAGARVAVIGAGGASRAVRQALAGTGAEVHVLGRGDLDRASEPWDLLVHATPVGTTPHDDRSVLRGRPIRARRVYDLVYAPSETQLMRDARAAGAAAIGGLPMLAAQARRQFEFWFDSPAPEGAYSRAAEAALSHEADDIRRVR